MKDFGMQAKVSWIGYLRFVIIFLLVGLLVTQFASIPLIWAGETLFGDIGVTVMSVAAYIAAPLLCLFYCLYRLFHFRAYTDDEGVWFYSGYFPWSEGIRGVRWENFDQVLYQPSMFSWFTRSYRIFLQDRYGNRITVKDLYNGHRWGGNVNNLFTAKRH